MRLNPEESLEWLREEDCEPIHVAYGTAKSGKVYPVVIQGWVPPHMFFDLDAFADMFEQHERERPKPEDFP